MNRVLRLLAGGSDVQTMVGSPARASDTRGIPATGDTQPGSLSPERC